MNLNDFYCHDVIIRNIQIDRTNPGNADTILFQIEWPEDNEKGFLVFEEVYWTSMNLNFGRVADESILSANQLEEQNEDLAKFYSKWKGSMNGVKLNTYKIELNSTGGEIKIIAKTFKIDKNSCN